MDQLKKQQVPDVYDEMFSKGGYQGSYDLPYHLSPYYPMYKKIVSFIKKYRVFNILEVGCGTGAFAKMILDRTNVNYRGFDFSSIAIEKSGRITNRPDLFHIGDATKLDSYPEEYEAIVCTEVLEHIPEDLMCIGRWRKGALCLCSVPNYDSPYHSRFFKSSWDVQKRYGGLLDIREISKVKKPVIFNASFNKYMQFFLNNRFKPKKLLAAVGLGRFKYIGGWYIFVGFKK